MSTLSHEDDRPVEALLSHTRLSAPSEELRTRILRAAEDAWNTREPVPAEISWRFPLLRLAASIALTFFLVRFADSVADREIAPWKPNPQATAPALHRTASNAGRAKPLAAIAAALAKKYQAQRLRTHVRHIQSLSDASADTLLEHFNQTS